LSRLGRFFENWFLHLRRLFHLLIGLAFMGLTVAGGLETFREWTKYQETPEMGLLYFKLYAGFTVFLAILSLYSLVKARNVR
jgi:hypothetical protein